MSDQPSRLTEIGENVFVASRGARLYGAEAIDDDGEHDRVVVAEIHGRWNRQDGSEAGTISVMFFAEGADRMAGGLRAAADEMRRADPPMVPPSNMLDDWIAAARFICDAVRHEESTAALSEMLDQFAEGTGVFLDPVTLRTMAFTLAAIQSAHLMSTDLEPDDPGFGDALVGALGAFAAVIVDRIDGKIP